MTAFITKVASHVSARRGWRRNLLAFLAGAIATAALAPVHVLPVLLISFPVLVWLIDGSGNPRAAFANGWWFGFGYFAFGLYWMANAFLVDAQSYAWLIPLPALLLPAVLALFTGAACAVARLLWTRGPERVVVLAIAWCIGEWLRGHLFTGLPWNLIGYVWAVSAPVLQTAAVVGIYGLSLLTVAVAATPAAVAGGDAKGMSRWIPVLSGAALCLVLFALGLARIVSADIGTVPGVKLRLVQANIDQKDKWALDKRRDNLVLHLTMSESRDSDRVTHVIWPETAVPYFVSEEPSRLVLIGGVMGPDGLVLTGAPRLVRGPRGEVEVWNSFHAIDHKGGIVATYDKTRLVPFGEYLPLRSVLEVLGLDKVVPGGTDFSPGPGIKTLNLAGLPPVGVLICYEIIFPGAVADRQERPEWLLNITNDAWYGRSAGPYQHFAMTRVRAVEEGLPVIRAAGTGISAVIDPLGRVQRSIGLGVRGVLDSELPMPLAVTPYARFGDRALVVVVIVLAGLALMTRHYRKKHRGI